MTRLAWLLAALLAVVGCSRDAESPETTAAKELGDLLDTGLGKGLEPVKSATGPMTGTLAAKSTAVPHTMLGPWLETHGFQGGYSRVWASTGNALEKEVLTSLVFHFFSERNAADFVAYSVDRIATSGAYTAFEDPSVPRSRVFTLVSRVAKATKFCASEYFPVGRDAYVVTRCAPYPVPVHMVTGLAAQQLVHAVTVAKP